MSNYNDILSHVLGGWSSDDRSEIAEHLDFIEDIDIAEPDYSFDLLRIYVRRHDGMILWATDSGCSCPAPFEDTVVSELQESTLSTFTDTAMGEIEGRYSARPVAEVRRDISDALAVAKARGAR